jgi:hypothetical protein
MANQVFSGCVPDILGAELLISRLGGAFMSATATMPVAAAAEPIHSMAPAGGAPRRSGAPFGNRS